MKTKPLQHQITGLARMQGKKAFALFCDMGTGKTYIALADAERAYLKNEIDAVLIFAPKEVHSNWVRREIPKHLEVPNVCFYWKSKVNKKINREIEQLFFSYARNPLRVLSMNFEAVNTKAGYDLVEKFVTCFRTMIIIDESSRIKTPTAQRTKKIMKIGDKCVIKRILSGTPLDRPTDLFTQFQFLEKGLLGTESYRAFVAEYSVLLEESDYRVQAIKRKLMANRQGGFFMTPQIQARDEYNRPKWKNLDKLKKIIEPHIYRVRKKDCLDLPEKIYQEAYFDLTKEQRQIYDKLKDDFVIELADLQNSNGNITLENVFENSDAISFQAIATMTKLQQICSGFVNLEGEPQLLDIKENPRMELLEEIIDKIDKDEQFIIWARFNQEIKQIEELLKNMGIDCRVYNGATSADDRNTIIDDFQAGKFRAFVGNAAAGGIGITLTAASYTIYYSYDYKLELRLQSEDRNHRIGSTKNVTYVTIMAIDTIDMDIYNSLNNKRQVAEKILDDK